MTANTAIGARTLASLRLGNAAPVDGENFDLMVIRQDKPAALPIRARATGETYEIDPFRGSASSSPTIVNACSLPSPRLNATRCPKATTLNSAGGGIS